MANLEWHKLYADIAQKYSEQSHDPRTKVGCVIVTQEGILYPGYNGDERGGSNKPDSLEPGQSGFVHAEANALMKFNPTIHKDSKLYLTHSPCNVCARMIVNARSINEVYYCNVYRSSDGLDILTRAGIKIVKL
jgi:dCMP deaminase